MPCIRTFAKPFVGPFVRPFFRLFAKLFAIMFLMSFDTSFISKFFMIPYHFYTICIIICHVMSCLYHLHYHLWCHSHTIFQNIRQANWKIATSLVGFCLKWFGSIFRWGFGLECPPQSTRTWLSNNGLFFSEAQCCYLKDDMRLKPLLNCCYFFLINLLM